MSPVDNYLICTLVGEARGEVIEGIIGVANVIKNRAYAAGKSYKDICLAPKQFSCWNGNDPNFPIARGTLSKLDNGDTIDDPYIRQCIAVARAVQEGDFLDNTKHAKNYVTIARYGIAKARQDPKLDAWIVNMRQSVTLGNHIFLV